MPEQTSTQSDPKLPLSQDTQLPISNEQNIKQPSNAFNKWLVIATALIVLCISVGFIMRLFVTSKNISKKNLQTPSQTITPIPSQVTSADWETYTMDTISIKLPNHYLINPEQYATYANQLNWAILGPSSTPLATTKLLGWFWTQECLDSQVSEAYLPGCFSFAIFKVAKKTNQSILDIAHRDFYPGCKDVSDVPQCRGKADTEKEIVIAGKKAYIQQGSMGPAVNHIEVYIDYDEDEFIHVGTADIQNVSKPNEKTTIKQAFIGELETIISTMTFNEPAPTSIFCGGIAAIRCPDGMSCQMDGNYPDAGGHCVAGEAEFKKMGPSPVITP